MCAAGVGKKMKMMKTLEAARAGHEGIHRPGFAHMPNKGMGAPPAIINRECAKLNRNLCLLVIYASVGF